MRRLGQHILLFLERPDIADFYRAADLYYTPTKYEGFSLAMLEAALRASGGDKRRQQRQGVHPG